MAGAESKLAAGAWSMAGVLVNRAVIGADLFKREVAPKVGGRSPVTIIFRKQPVALRGSVELFGSEMLTDGRILGVTL
jgi:hypothetical protein